MESYEMPPFNLGQTVKGTADDGTTLINTDWLGQVHEFQYETRQAISRGGKKRKSGRTIRAILTRNASGIALLPKRIVQFEVTAGLANLHSVAGYCNLLANPHCAIVDDSLPAAGVADKDLFWAIVQGPVLTLAPMVGAAFNGTDISVGNKLVACTGVTSQATSAGRITNASWGDVTLGVFTAAVNLIGTALSARTTGESTGAQDLLINAQIRW
jgi:hypothetical protein